jgi:hypothetical protein
MPTAQNGTFGFARHTSQRFAKPKEPFFCQRTDIVSTLKLILTELNKANKIADGIKRIETKKGT